MSVTTNNTPALTSQTPLQAPISNAQAVYLLSVTPGLTTSIATISTTEVVFPITGIQLGDVVTVVRNAYTAGLGVVNARVTTANAVSVTFVNPTAAGIALGAADNYTVTVTRPIAQAVTNGLPTALPLS